MTRKINFILLLVMVFTLFGQGQIQAKRVEGYRFRNSLITPYLIRRILPDKNMLFAANFQVAWNKFADEISRQPIALKGNPIMMQMLNRRLTGAQDLSEDCYLAMAGIQEDEISDRATQALSDKFDETPEIDLKLKNPRDILLYTFLVKDINFAEEFERLEKPIMFNQSTPVRAFGIKEFVLDESHIRAAEQVEIIYYNNDNDFIIRLRSRAENDEIFLAKIPPLKTLSATASYVLTQANINRPQELKEKDTLQIPVIEIDIVDWFMDLEGRCLESRGMEDFCIAKAIQSIKFRLVQNAPPYELLPSVGEEKKITKPRKFIFDMPFLLLIRQRGAGYPYFVLWVQNTELLTEAR
jgi:hypothetical protein